MVASGGCLNFQYSDDASLSANLIDSRIDNGGMPSVASESAIADMPVQKADAAFVYDVNDIHEAIGICDYVFIGEVVSYDGVTYRNLVKIEDFQGDESEVGSPYSEYTVRVVDNIKGSLVTDRDIKISKQGGVSQDCQYIILFNDDQLPISGSVYVFLGYAQADGSILISGPASNVLVDDIAMAVEQYKDAYANEIVPIERERYKSYYESE